MTGRGGLVSQASGLDTARVRNNARRHIDALDYSMWLAESADIQRLSQKYGRYFGALSACFPARSGGGEVERQPVCRDTHAAPCTISLTPKFCDAPRAGARARGFSKTRGSTSSFGDVKILVGRRSGNPWLAVTKCPAPVIEARA